MAAAVIAGGVSKAGRRCRIGLWRRGCQDRRGCALHKVVGDIDEDESKPSGAFREESKAEEDDVGNLVDDSVAADDQRRAPKRVANSATRKIHSNRPCRARAFAVISRGAGRRRPAPRDRGLA